MDQCQAIFNLMQCELSADHVRPTRRVMHDFGGRVGRCHLCGLPRRDSATKDCMPYPPVPHRVTIHW